MLIIIRCFKKKNLKINVILLADTSLNRSPLCESSFSSLEVEVMTSNCLSEDGAKQTWRAESTIDLSVVIVLISTLKTCNGTTTQSPHMRSCLGNHSLT